MNAVDEALVTALESADELTREQRDMIADRLEALAFPIRMVQALRGTGQLIPRQLIARGWRRIKTIPVKS